MQIDRGVLNTSGMKNGKISDRECGPPGENRCHGGVGCDWGDQEDPQQEPLPGRKEGHQIPRSLAAVREVVYSDLLDQTWIAYQIYNTNSALSGKHTGKAGRDGGNSNPFCDREQRYWQKILADRRAKRSQPREKKSTEELITKAEKIRLEKTRRPSKHIRFSERG
ncbi:La-related protein 7 [Tupaia chinensis]|uniref:La-related protein 7 n=1 Tax=Tupaia chinensis TaxID=246437 RepID=L9KDW2_TUPCH|nr:La-related protein 7 [Tupaia chinensis]